MKLYYRDWVPWNDSLLEWHPSGWSDTGVVQVAWHWRIGSPLAYFDIYWGRFGSSGSSVTQWLCSGTVAVHWVDSNFADAEYFAEIVASDWSRARNPGFSLVERSLRKFSKGVPLQSWMCANRALLTSNNTGLVHMRSGNFSNSSRCWLIGRFPLIKGNDRLAILPMTSLTQDWTIDTGLVNW